MVKANFLKERAEEFLETVDYHLKKSQNNLAALDLEQAAQLYLKYYLFLKIRDYPATHSLEKLLKELKKVYPHKKLEIDQILKEEASTIGDLEQAYITSRYLPAEFSENRIEKMQKFVEKMLKFLKKL